MSKEFLILLVSSFGLATILVGVSMYRFIKNWVVSRVIQWIASKEKLPVFPFGLAFKPKINRHYFFGKNNAFDHFFTYTPDAAYLFQILPPDTKWPHPSTKHFLFENVGTKESVSIFAEKLKTYGEYSMSLLPGQKRILEEFTGNPTTQGMTDWQKLCWNWKIYWYGERHGQTRLLYKKITFADVNGDAKSITWRREEESAVLFSCFYEYGIESDEAEDINNIRLQIIFSISGRCINPDVAGLRNENPLKRAYSMLQSCAGLIAKMNSFHLLHENVGKMIDDLPEDQKQQAKDSVRQLRYVFQDEIIKMLSKPENFIGFEWGHDSVNILQVRAVGDEAKQMLKDIIEAYTIQFKNKAMIDKAIAENTIKEADAKTTKQVAITLSEQLFTVRENDALADARALEIQVDAAQKHMSLLEGNQEAIDVFKMMQAAQMSDVDPAIIMLAQALKNSGGLNVMNLGDLFKDFLKPQAQISQTT
ncbi:MAG TPA: hypothetical protein PKZ56_00655 [Candidatus Paceibacterota bacterium]|nr:hypothetical protein [Candidatus Paceibacterota bacterium]